MSFLDNFRKRKYKQKIKIATDLVKEGKNKEAIDAYNEAFKSLINLGDYVSLACLYVDEGEYNKAIDIFNDVIIKIQSKGLDKDLADIHFGLGVCYDSLRQINKAIENYEKAISEGSNSVDCIFYLANLYDELELPFESKETTRAIELYNKVISIKPDYIYSYINIANLYVRYDKDDEAFPFFLKAKELDTNNETNSSYNMGVAYQSKNDFDNAEKYYLDELKSKKPYAQTNYNLGVLYKDNHQYEKAKYYYLKAIEKNKEEYNAWYNLACVYALMDDFDNAFSCFEYIKYNKHSYLETTKEDADLVKLRLDKRYKELFTLK